MPTKLKSNSILWDATAYAQPLVAIIDHSNNGKRIRKYFL